MKSARWAGKPIIMCENNHIEVIYGLSYFTNGSLTQITQVRAFDPYFHNGTMPQFFTLNQGQLGLIQGTVALRN